MQSLFMNLVEDSTVIVVDVPSARVPPLAIRLPAYPVLIPLFPPPRAAYG